MPSVWHHRQASKQHKMHKRSAGSITQKMNSMQAASTGLFDEFGQAIGILVDCYLEVQVTGLRNTVNIRILFRNTSGQDVRKAIFRARTAPGATVTSVECYVDVDGLDSDSSSGLEYRDVEANVVKGSIAECEVGKINANRDCVIFMRYEHMVDFDGDKALVRLPLPGRRGEKLITRQQNQPAMWNASQMFSFIALDIQIVDYPSNITNITSTHAMTKSIERNGALIELDDTVLQGQDDVVLRIASEGSDDDDVEALSLNMESGLEARGQESETTNPCAVQVVISEEGSPARIPVFSIYEEISQDLCGRSHSSLARQRDEERKLEGEQQKASLVIKPSFEHPRGPSPDIEVDRLYSDIWEVNEARLSYISDTDSTMSSKDLRTRRRKTTVHKKYMSNASSLQSNLSGMSWLDDASDDEDVDNEAEKIFEQYSSIYKHTRLPEPTPEPKSPETDEDYVAECMSIKIVKHNRPKIVDISPVSPKLPQNPFENLTPPTSPFKSIAEYCPRNSMELSRELDYVLNCLNRQIEDSPTPYLLLNQQFAATLGLSLLPLKHHAGAQAHNLADVPFWIREGIWANAIALQFLQCVMDSPFFKTLTEEVKMEYRILYNVLNAPLNNQEAHLSPAALANRYCEDDLMELASQVIQQQLIDGEDVNEIKGKQTQHDQFVARPISPPKTPDEDDRQKVNIEVFVDCF